MSAFWELANEYDEALGFPPLFSCGGPKFQTLLVCLGCRCAQLHTPTVLLIALSSTHQTKVHFLFFHFFHFEALNAGNCETRENRMLLERFGAGEIKPDTMP